MNAERYRQIEAVLDEALDLPEGERADFLLRVCGDDLSLRADVERLLVQDGRTDGILDAPVERGAVSFLDGLWQDDAAGSLVGPYRILHEVGRGGMGAVYLAERADGQFEQRVALKLIKRGMDTDEVERRFLAERQILARLVHPNIARLLDGGVSADGRPYFAMEYVDGVPLVVNARHKQLPVPVRLEQFLAVCSAVQYAHRNLVVHRDLKPSNVLVTEDGQVKLLDFGIAKLLDPQEDDLTRTGLQVLTPEYSAPEQLRGEPVTTATDVYALGLLLSELLTGERPKRTRGGETDAAKLAGDLDLIVLAALREEPERRYPSAEAFADDVRRYLSGLPVLARKDSPAYRARKFVARHRWGVAAAGLVALSLVAGVAGTLWQARRSVRQAHKTEEVKDFLVSLFSVSDPDQAKGREITARALLDQGSARLDQELAGQPEVRDEMLALMGELYYKLGEYDRSLPLLKRDLELRKRLYGPRHPKVAEILKRLALVTTARQGDLATTEQLLRQALDICRAALGGAHQQTGETLAALANVVSDQGRYDEAGPLFAEAIEVLGRSVGEVSPEVARTLDDQAEMFADQGNHQSAGANHERALEIRRKLYGEVHTEVATSVNNLAWQFFVREDYARAAQLYRQALDIHTRLLGPDHPSVAVDLSNLGSVHLRQGDFVQAEQLLRRAVAAEEKAVGRDSPQMALLLHNLAFAKLQLGRAGEAESLLVETLALSRRQVGDDHPQTAFVRSTLGRVLAEEGRLAEAEDHLGRALAVFRAKAPEHPKVGEILGRLGGVLLASGRVAHAEPLLREAVARQEKPGGSDELELATTRLSYGRCLLALGRGAEALPHLEKSLAAFAARPGTQHAQAVRAAREALDEARRKAP